MSYPWINSDFTQNQNVVDGSFSFGGNYGTAGSHGDTLPLSTICPGIASSSVPLRVEIWEQPAVGAAPTGYVFQYVPNTTIDNGLIQVLECGGSGAPMQEITQGAPYPSALGGVVIRVRVWLPSLV